MSSRCRLEKPLPSRSRASAAREIQKCKALIVDHSPDVIAVTTPARQIRFWSKGAEVATGWTASEAIGRDFFEILRVSDRIGLREAFEGVAAGGSWEGEFETQNRAGSVRVLRGRWQFVQDDEDTAGSLLLVNSDVTDLKQTRPDNLRAQRLDNIGELACGIAHDLNNVLSPVLIGADVLEASCKGREQLDMVQMIRSSAQRGAQIVRQILLFARGQEGTRVPVEGSHLIREVGQVLQSTLPKNVAFQTSATADAGCVIGDETELQQVLLNLCINARDAMPAGGNLKLSVERVEVDDTFAAMVPGAKAAPYVAFSVADTGCGIPQENMERVFDPLFTTKGVGRGTGLGLATVRGIVRSHGGFLRCESAVGRGTVFVAYLPAVNDAAADRPVISEESGDRGSGELILLADDEPVIADLYRSVLESHGYRAIVATDGVAALALFGQHRSEIRAVISDIAMPLMDGVALTRAIRHLDGSMPVLIATGTTEGPILREVEEFPLVTVIRKPCTQHALLAAVRHSIDSIPHTGCAAEPAEMSAP